MQNQHHYNGYVDSGSDRGWDHGGLPLQPPESPYYQATGHPVYSIDYQSFPARPDDTYGVRTSSPRLLGSEYNTMYMEQSFPLNNKLSGHVSVDPEVKTKPAQPVPIADQRAQHAEDEAALAEAMSFAWSAAPPPYTVSSPLEKPIAIPQLTQSKTTTFMTPLGSSANMYARVYSPALAQHGISETEFLGFIDGLNAVCTSSQKIQAMSLATQVLSFDPSGTMQLITMGAGIGLQVSQQKIFDRRGAAFLQRANDDFFRRRGLKVQKCTLEELRRIAHIPSDLPLTLPLSADLMCASIVETRVRVMQPWLAPLKFDVPPPPAPQSVNTLQKINNFQSKHLNKQLHRDVISNRLKLMSKEPHAFSEEEVQRVVADVRATGDRTLIWKASHVEKKILKKRSGGPESPALYGQAGNKNKKEEEAARRSNWLVITRLDL